MIEKQINLYPETTQILDAKYLRKAKIPLNDEEILIVEVNSHDRKTVSTWMDYSEDIRRNWSTDKPLFILVDMSKEDFAFGAYANKRARDMMGINPDIPTYIAWVTQKSIIGNLMQATLELFNRRSRKARFMLVHSREQGYEWLEETYIKDQR
ncbi:MAG: hypothetical protein Phog2KO_34290 [Phototrophicaceae bacterium]